MKSKLLFISPSSPFPARDGKRQRTLALLLAVLDQYEVDFLILGSPSDLELSSFSTLSGVSVFSIPQEENRFWIKKMGISYFPNPAIRQQLREFLFGKSYAKIFCRYALAARDLPPGTPFFLDVDDDYAELMQTKIAQQNIILKKLRYRQIFALNRMYYSRILKRATQLIWVRAQGDGKADPILPNLPFQLLFEEFQVLQPAQNQDLLFVGKLSYDPNAMGIRWFLEMIWLGLREDLQDIQLTLISSARPNPELESLIQSSPGVTLQFNVENLVQAYQNHAICIVPVFFGGGSNVKLAEALLMGRKVISSPFGIRGFEHWVDSGLVQVATSLEDWKIKIQEMLKEPWEESQFLQVREEFSQEKWNHDLIRILDED